MRHAALALLLALAAGAQRRQVAITFDDLPRGGDTARGRDLESIRTLTVKLTEALRGVPVNRVRGRGRGCEGNAARDRRAGNQSAPRSTK